MSTLIRAAGRVLAWTFISVSVGILVAATMVHAGESAWKPQKNVELVVGAQAGGANDRMGRILQKILTDNNTGPISMTVMNKPGQGQSLGVAYVNSHSGDPHYLVILGSSWVTTAINTRSTTTHRDLTPILKLVDTDLVMYVPADSPIADVKALVQGLRKGTQAYSFGFSTAAGNASHIALAQLARYANYDPRKLRVVVNASGSITATQVAGGHIQAGISSSGSAAAVAAAGKVRFIGALAERRLPGLPELATLQEQGFEVTAPTWFTVFGPKGLQAQHVSFWEDALIKAMRHPEAKQFVDANNWTLDFVGAKRLPSLLDQEYEKLRGLLADLGMVK
jgi:putative tricarboxylic transport membrane protein